MIPNHMSSQHIEDKGGSAAFPFPENLTANLIQRLEFVPEQVAQHPDQITPDTKVYIGSLLHYDDQRRIIPIFNKLAGVEYIYTSPERRIRREILEIDGRLKSPEQALAELDQAGIKRMDYVENMARKTPFTGNPRSVNLVWLDGDDMGLTDIRITTERFERGMALGLVTCDQEVGVYQRLADTEQPLNTGYSMVMETIAGRHSESRVFQLRSNVNGLWLDGRRAEPDRKWYPVSRLVFVLPQAA